VKKHRFDLRDEMVFAREKWGSVCRERLTELRKLIGRYRISVALGDVLYIDNRWYVTHAGLLRLSERRR
jgi:hypothetical protein